MLSNSHFETFVPYQEPANAVLLNFLESQNGGSSYCGY